ncbi:MAG: methionine adenosyltransferase [Fimbriimonadaceae bacterium]|nr:MAG: methionine adenosyltransferase [Fimbriimonadaceae bacterium]
MAYRHIYTSESVSEGHPDKLADQISDAILDAVFIQDPMARVAIETMVGHGFAVVSGELSTHNAYVDVAQLVRQTIKDVGYVSTDLGFDGGTCGVMVAIHEQSRDIAMGVDRGGAGDQGMMFGLATTETLELMPLPIAVAHALTRRSASIRREKPSLGLRPDAKSQVSVTYENGMPVEINTIVLSQQHSPDVENSIRDIVRAEVIDPVLAEYSKFVKGDITFHINPTGRFVTGGPEGDTGLTGRKIIVDTYGGLCPHGGGAFSGKDPTKVDRSAAYMARHIAKCVVAAGLAEKAQIGLAYAIGVEQPVSVNVETFGTESIDLQTIADRIKNNFDMSPAGIIKHLDLRRPIYLPTAKNGHFGNASFPWEDTNPAAALKS